MILGLKRNKIQSQTSTGDDRRFSKRNYDGFIEQLASVDPVKRRWAARDLVDYPDAIDTLLTALRDESEHPVREAIFDSLQHIGGEAVVTGMISILRLEDAELRNGAIEVLQSMPEEVALHIIELLNDQDSDVRIFAIDILQVLAHPQTPEWLLSVLKDETHINVIATAIDRLSEVGTPDMVPALEDIKRRFPDEPYLSFALGTTIRRIEGD